MFKNYCTLRVIFVLTCGVVVLLGGILFLSFWGMPRIIKAQVHKQTELEKGTDQWNRFEELPFPLDFSVRFFQVMNGPEIISNNATPIVNETNPYKYKMKIIKTNIAFNESDDTVTYDRTLTFEFVNSSTITENDEVTIINPVLMCALQLTNVLEKLALVGCMDVLLKPLDNIFMTASVKQILFDGITFAHRNNTNLGVGCNIIRNKMLKIVEGIRVIEHVNDTENDNDYLRFAIFNYKTKNFVKENPDGIYTVNRGINDISQLGNVMRWNGKTHLSQWGRITSINNDTCNRVRGTDSTIYRPYIQANDYLEIFNTDLCRSVKLIYKSSNETYKNIKAYRYEVSPTTFRPSTENPENDCFCSKATKDIKGEDNCFLDGVFDFKPCIGSPTLISMPHFLDADEIYQKAINGMQPDREKHDIYLLLEPNTGTPLEGRKRVQLNTILRREALVSLTPSTMYEAVFPVLWLEEGVNLPQEYVDLINNQYFHKVSLANDLKYGFIAAVAALLAVCLFFLGRKWFHSAENAK